MSNYYNIGQTSNKPLLICANQHINSCKEFSFDISSHDSWLGLVIERSKFSRVLRSTYMLDVDVNTIQLYGILIFARWEAR